MTRILLLALTAFLLQEPGPPPEPGPDTPACDNHFKSAHKCACGKAMKCNGHVDDAPDPAIGTKFCTNYCKKAACFCVGPCETHLRRQKGGRS